MHALASETKATVDRNDAVILEWQYTPANFFEEPVVIPGPDYEIRIEGGEARATVAPEAYDDGAQEAGRAPRRRGGAVSSRSSS